MKPELKLIKNTSYENEIDAEIRKTLGIHYTDKETIHKIIDPLFLDLLEEELEKIKRIESLEEREKKLKEYQNKLSSLTFLDPASGSGNFLVEIYISLRKLENEALKELYFDGSRFNGINPVKVTVEQFHGIEIDKEAIQLSKKALVIAEREMMKITEKILKMPHDSLIMLRHPNIIAGNALRMEWDDVVPRTKLNYIVGNPPYIGSRLLTDSQREDMEIVWSGVKKCRLLDYATAWFKKATQMMENTNIRTAFIVTESICQAEQAAVLWGNLFESGVHIDFAYSSFKWTSDSKNKAKVFCVIVGFSIAENTCKRQLFDNGVVKTVNNINAYLMDAPNFFIEPIETSLNDLPPISNCDYICHKYLFSPEEMREFINKDPKAEKRFTISFGNYGFINNKPKYYLSLSDENKNELEKTTPKPQTNVLVLPTKASGRRKYNPIAFTPKDTPVYLYNCAMYIKKAGLYDFALLTSSVHMAWVRKFGRIKKDSFRYTKKTIYNNFPTPNPTPEQKSKIEQCAQEILKARNLYPDCTLAYLYNPETMPKELEKAHKDNDEAVKNAYGFKNDITEEECVKELINLYLQLKEKENIKLA